jgi:hypothetical protein
MSLRLSIFAEEVGRAAWPLRSGEEGYSLKLTTIPLNWDGRFVLLPPLNNEEVPQDEEWKAGDASTRLPFCRRVSARTETSVR